ncbi:hypothetical protein TNCV_3580091 [Trichonephila clavipes]|nr:hypothetical protein TNCV_3580091 [Trichonephila clavipes]
MGWRLASRAICPKYAPKAPKPLTPGKAGRGRFADPFPRYPGNPLLPFLRLRRLARARFLRESGAPVIKFSVLVHVPIIGTFQRWKNLGTNFNTSARCHAATELASE